MSVNTIKGLYQQLATLLKDYRTAGVSTEQIHKTIIFSSAVLETFKSQPDLTVAQSLLYKPQLPYTINLVLNHCVLTTLIATRNKVNETCTLQLVCTVISLYADNQSQIEKYYTGESSSLQYSRNPSLLNALNKSGQDVWANGYQLISKLSHKITISKSWPQECSFEQRLLFISHQLAILTTPNNITTKQSFASALKITVQQSPTSWLDNIAPLLDYPTLTPPGSLIKLSNGESGIVLSVSLDGFYFAPIKNSDDAVIHVKREKVSLSSGSQRLKSFKMMEKWWSSDWVEAKQTRLTNSSPFYVTFKIDSPPTILLNIQKYVANEEIDITKLSEMIASEPALAHHLTDTASQSNRHKLPIEDVKHAIMMHGYERANHLIVQQALLLRLNQNFFPLQEQFIQFTKLRAQVAANLISCISPLFEQQAYTLACFASSGLFTIAQLKSKKQWKTNPSRMFDITHLLETQQQERLYQNAISLAQAWQQTPDMIFALHYHNRNLADMPSNNRMGKNLAVIMGLSLIIAREIYFVNESHCSLTNKYLQDAIEHLNLSSTDLEDIKQQSVALSHVVCPL